MKQEFANAIYECEVLKGKIMSKIQDRRLESTNKHRRVV